MKAVVVFESHWGNTAAIARAIAEGMGAGTQALTTSEATASALAGVDFIVAGSPLLGFSLPTEQMIHGLATNPGTAPNPPDISHPGIRTWLSTLPTGSGRCAAFETRIWWSPGSAAKTIENALTRIGYRSASKARQFIVKGRYGPLKDGELEKARLWGAELAGQAS